MNENVSPPLPAVRSVDLDSLACIPSPRALKEFLKQWIHQAHDCKAIKENIRSLPFPIAPNLHRSGPKSMNHKASRWSHFALSMTYINAQIPEESSWDNAEQRSRRSTRDGAQYVRRTRRRTCAAFPPPILRRWPSILAYLGGFFPDREQRSSFGGRFGHEANHFRPMMRSNDSFLIELRGWGALNKTHWAFRRHALLY